MIEYVLLAVVIYLGYRLVWSIDVDEYGDERSSRSPRE